MIKQIAVQDHYGLVLLKGGMLDVFGEPAVVDEIRSSKCLDYVKATSVRRGQDFALYRSNKVWRSASSSHVYGDIPPRAYAFLQPRKNRVGPQLYVHNHKVCRTWLTAENNPCAMLGYDTWQWTTQPFKATTWFYMEGYSKAFALDQEGQLYSLCGSMLNVTADPGWKPVEAPLLRSLHVCCGDLLGFTKDGYLTTFDTIIKSRIQVPEYLQWKGTM